MGYKFTLVLDREISSEESATLRQADAVCADATFGPDTLPTNANVPVTRMDIDDGSAPSLAEAIQSALDAVKKVPDLGVPSLTVPAQPEGPVDKEAATVGQEEATVGADGQPAAGTDEPAAEEGSAEQAA